MTDAVGIYLGELDEGQLRLASVLRGLEDRLGRIRMERRCGRTRLGDTGARRDLSPAPTRRVTGTPALPEPPAPPRAPLVLSMIAAEPPARPGHAAPVRAPDRDAAIEAGKQAGAVVFGNRLLVVLIAAARRLADGAGSPLLDALFPAAAIGDRAAGWVEIALYSARPRTARDDAAELDVSEAVPRLVPAGRHFRALPWSADVKGQLVRAFRLGEEFGSVAPCLPHEARPGRLRAGGSFVVLSCESRAMAAARESDGAKGEADPVEPPPLPRRAGNEAGRDPRSGPGPAGTPTGSDQREAILREAWAGLAPRFARPLSFEDFVALLRLFEQTACRLGDEPAHDFWAEFAVWIASSEVGVVAPPRSVSATRADAGRTAADAAANAVELERAAREPARGWRTIAPDRARLVRKFKHAPDFGVYAAFSNSALEAFAEAIAEHVRHAGERHLVTYRGRRMIAHVSAGRIVITTLEGKLETGYRASPRQLRHAWSSPPWSGR